MLKIVLVSILFLFINAQEGELNFGVTSVALKQDAKNIFDLTTFLSKETGVKITPKFAKSYDEIKQMLEKREVDFAYVCGATYIEAKHSASLEILALPYFDNKPFYKSLVIARDEDEANSLLSFENRIFAFSDPKSNSGSIVPKYELKMRGIDYRYFFSEFIHTYDHSDSIEAVIDGYVDGASVDSLVFESYKLLKPERAKKVKVVQSFGEYQSTPIVVRKSVDIDIKLALLDALRKLSHEDDGVNILDGFGVCRFDLPEKIDFSRIEMMMKALDRIDD